MIACYARSRPRDRNLHLADEFGLIPFGTDSAHTDGAHPDDHRFRMIAERLAPQIEEIILRDP
jgi:hypothetical protein